MTLSHKLGIPTQRLKSETTWSDFLDHVAFIKEEEQRAYELKLKQREPIHFYLAQIACEIYKKFRQDVTGITPESFLMNFTSKKKENAPERRKSEEPKKTQEEMVEDSKRTLLGALGIPYSG